MVTNVNNTARIGVKIDSHVALVDVLNVMSYRAWPSAPALARFTFLIHQGEMLSHICLFRPQRESSLRTLLRDENHNPDHLLVFVTVSKKTTQERGDMLNWLSSGYNRRF